jgi:hypothetical protein
MHDMTGGKKEERRGSAWDIDLVYVICEGDIHSGWEWEST